MKKSIIVISFLIIAALALLFSSVFSLGRPYSIDNTPTQFIIAKGDNVEKISQELVADKIIKSAWYFNFYTRWHDLRSKIKAGTYELSPSLSVKEILEKITKGDVVNREKTITVIPGWNLSDIKKYFIDNGIVTENDFSKISKLKVGQWNLNFVKPDFLNDVPANASLEGFLFPDTYRVFNNATAEDVTRKMLNNFDLKLTPAMRADITKRGKSIYEVIIIASIIEKEVKSPADMKIVSGIFWQRLDNNYPLESCATLAYILGVNKQQYSLEDTKINSPYNTYKNAGLPPGPICNPGLAAIQAAIYPETTNYHYFLSRPDNGETVFSKTYQEHLQNKTKYLK